jgi:hypothetical protein
MSTTTALDLLERADLLIRQLRSADTPTTTTQWETFDNTVYRLLLELVGIDTQHVRTADRSWRALDLAIRSYPQPLRPPVDAHLSPAQAARYQEGSRHALLGRIRAGHLDALKDGDTHVIQSRDIDTRPDLRPADPADPHPLAKVSCTLGAMADLVHDARIHGPAFLDRQGEAAGAVMHVLSLAAVAARHTLAHRPLDAADRPLTVGRYAERVIDTLRTVALEPVSLNRLASVAAHPRPTTLNDRLEAALDNWQCSAREELNRAIPSIEVVRQIANQGVHVCGIRAKLQADAHGDEASRLHAAAQALAQGDRAWARLTTLTRPSHEFVIASRELYESLGTIGRAIAVTVGRLDADRTAHDLDRGLANIADLMALTQSFPDRLLAADLLRGPAKALRTTDDRLHHRTHGRFVPVRRGDVPELTASWQQACHAIGTCRGVDAMQPTEVML